MLVRYQNPPEQCRNLYRFIRLIAGEELSDREIARRWGVDEKNLRELKNGVRVVPKLARLESLAEMLGLHKYYVIEAASGIPAERVHRILKNSTLDAEFREIENIFGGSPLSGTDRERIVAGLQSAAFHAPCALDVEEIFQLVSRELKRFDFDSHVFNLDQEDGSAVIRHSTFSPGLIKAAETVTGLSLSSFRFPLKQVPVFQTVVGTGRPIFLQDATVLLGQILDDRPYRRFIERMTRIFKILEVALLPVVVQGRVKGVFATGREGKLNEAYLPEVRFFSDQLSLSVEKALLLQMARESEGRLKSLFNNLPEGVFECDREGRILQINLAGARILGFRNPEEPIGEPIQAFQLLNPSAQSVRKHIKKSRRTATQNLVGVAVRKDGSSFLADVTIRTERDRKGRVERTQGVFRDFN